jgi:hypothetical protein
VTYGSWFFPRGLQSMNMFFDLSGQPSQERGESMHYINVLEEQNLDSSMNHWTYLNAVSSFCAGAGRQPIPAQAAPRTSMNGASNLPS